MPVGRCQLALLGRGRPRIVERPSSPLNAPPVATITPGMSRYLFAALTVLLAVACATVGTHELCAHVLAFDWTSTGADVVSGPVSVQLP